ncbi:MAG: Asp-tRNA(Asn)/Glu-tRNA(Gln) amidotransferase subunit GatC [Holosporales bacterium]|jgi:aspartyl-tRNA(Asn)/glutamyl-tRNA(Gln) amidotransferase subunit C|nr:Asp-tRNA(Asn)/Glu-tRNA(Gln) amidotransferase subunit GatC [Holosporales bacterium]
MGISNQNVKNIAKLAAISLSEDEVPFISSELDSIMTWINQLQDVDVSSITLHNDATSLPERADVVTERDMCVKILANAPDSVDQWFAVPKIIKQ